MRILPTVLKSMLLLTVLNASCSKDDDEDALPANIVAAAQATPALSTLVSLVSERPAIAEALKGANLTVFAPTNEAFAAASLSGLSAETVTKILQYHVVSVADSKGILSTELEAAQAPATLTGEKIYVTKSGNAVKVNGDADVTTADVKTANGSVVHIVDAVLLPDILGNVVQAVLKRYDLSSLGGAVASREAIATALSSNTGTFTVFAPSNAAFAKLSAVPTGEALDAVLKYHVLTTKVESKDITAATTVATLNGASITAAPEEEKVTVADATATKANVTEADILTANGVIHVIDKVLLPE